MNRSADITRYLLGEPSDDERAAFEEQYVADPRLFDEVVQAENDLIDDYVRGTLAPDVRDRFERAYLADPARRERVKFAEALVAKLDRTERPAVVAASAPGGLAGRRRFDWLLGPKPALGFAFATLVIVLGLRLAFEVRRAPRETSQRETARTDQPGEKAPAAQPPPTPVPSAVVLALAVGSGSRAIDRSSPTPLVIPPGTTEVRLQLTMHEREYPAYRVILRGAGGAEILRRGPLMPAAAGSGSILEIGLPASQFESGDYIVTLQGALAAGGFEDVSRSLVRIDKR
jgi:anti-sigma factor RsiW